MFSLFPLTFFLFQNIQADLGQQEVTNPTKFHFETTASCDYFFENQTWCSQIFHLEADSFNYDNFGVSDVVCFNRSHMNYFENRVENTGLTGNFEIVIGVRHNCTASGEILEAIVHEQDYKQKSDGKYDIQTVVSINEEGSFGQNGWDKNRFKGSKVVNPGCIIPFC